MKQSPANHPTVLVIFGATGDLAQKKLLPALYHLLRGGVLPKEFKIVCIARNPSASLDNLLDKARTALARQDHIVEEDVAAELKSRLTLVVMDSTKATDYTKLKDALAAIDKRANVTHNCLYYLAIPPDIFTHVITCLGETGLNVEAEGNARRILVEKPFGTDFESAQRLIGHIEKYFAEEQVYRIDHYLAKETAQNILTFRHSNPIIENLWGRQFIDHIQITAAETIDIEGRSNFYEGMGALRDLVQSHLLQLMALTLMDVPERLVSASIHAEKLQVLNAVRPLKESRISEQVVRGQYTEYREETSNMKSNIETYVAIELEVNNSRWGGVPILLRTGKALAKKSTEINVVFKDRSRRSVEPNILTIRIQPNEGISIVMQAKKPGFKHELQPVHMNFSYDASFSEWQPDAYERVLVDAMNGDQTLFASSDEVLACWNIIQPIIDAWKNDRQQPETYHKGTWGPLGADELAENIGYSWLNGS